MERKRKETDLEYLPSYIRHLESRIKVIETDNQLLRFEISKLNDDLKTINKEIESLVETPLLVGTVIDVLDENGERMIIKASTNVEYVVKSTQKVRENKVFTGTNVALNQRSFSVVDTLPTTNDPQVKGMELLESLPNISYDDIGGLDEQIQEIRETVELPLLKPELFKKIGIEPPKGALFYGPPGTGKTLLAKAVAHETKSTFIRVVGSELVQKFIGEGARLIREIFELAKNKAPTILFIDELDAIAATRIEDATSGDREVSRTLMQLLSELDGFDNRGDVKFIGATNRIDMLDNAILRPGRFDRLIEFPIPNELSRELIFNIHTKNLNADQTIDLKKYAQLTEGKTGSDIKAICTEAGMNAIRRNSEIITNQDFLNGINKVIKKDKNDLSKSNLFI
ncbi:MAG: proteasome-activating nucleotidase [Candidatus Lokiarchaeota archaeon]|nr:proteasome-activating nucleotidase [Candidatus Lokiarchaeota archaeon]